MSCYSRAWAPVGWMWEGGTSPETPITGLLTEETGQFPVGRPEAPLHLPAAPIPLPGGGTQPPLVREGHIHGTAWFLCRVPGRDPRHTVHTLLARLFPILQAGPSCNHSHADMCVHVRSLGAVTPTLCTPISPKPRDTRTQGQLQDLITPRAPWASMGHALISEQGICVTRKLPADGAFTNISCSAPSDGELTTSGDDCQDCQPWGTVDLP